MKKTSILPNDLQKVIHKYAVHGNYKLVGSSATRGNLYWSDLDIETRLSGRADALAERFQKVAKQKDDVYWIELKAGLDERLNSESKILNAPYVSDYQKSKLKKLRGLEKEEFIRSFYILRWTRNEVAQGYKYLLGKGKKLLVDAIQDDTILKLDLIVPKGDNLYDVSEMYFYKQTPQDYDEIMKALEDDVDYYKSSNTFKSLKRLYSIFKMKEDESKLELFDEFFNSSTGYLNKIIADLTIVDMIQDRPTQSYLMDIQVRLGNLSQVPKRFIPMVLTNRKKAIEGLRAIVNRESKEFIQSNLC
jgi:hypothetical protein